MQHSPQPSAAAAASAPAAGTARRTSARYRILALLAFGTMINYLDAPCSAWPRPRSPRSSGSAPR